VYEGGIRVPMIASWPGRIKEGTTNGHVSAFWDVLPTLTELVGAETPADIDGVSFLPTLLGDRENQKKHEYLYWELGNKQAIRAGAWKAIRYVNRAKTEAGPIELYHLTRDPGEIHDVSAEYKRVTKKMEGMFSSVRTPSSAFPLFRGEGERNE
jgi:arylsulfatase A-like enzyme